MENFEYSSVFSSEGGEANELDPNKAETIKNFLRSYERKLSSSPHFFLPYAPAIFEKTVADCEQIAKDFFGKINAKNRLLPFQCHHRTVVLLCRI